MGPDTLLALSFQLPHLKDDSVSLSPKDHWLSQQQGERRLQRENHQRNHFVLPDSQRNSRGHFGAGFVETT